MYYISTYYIVKKMLTDFLREYFSKNVKLLISNYIFIEYQIDSFSLEPVPSVPSIIIFLKSEDTLIYFM